MRFESSLFLIGNTPLLQLSRIYRGPGQLFGKAEFMSPGGSVKDRAALHIVRDAYASGKLRRGQGIVEMTSGNMGAGLAIVAGVYGHRFTAVMSAGNSPARAAMLRGLGAEVVLVPQVDGGPGQVTGNDIAAAIEQAQILSVETGDFYVDQFHNPSSVKAHLDGTGPEIFCDLNTICAFVAAAGSGGTFVGVSKYLKQQNRDIICAVVEPEGAEVLAGKPVVRARHNMQGIGYGMALPHWEENLADLYLSVSSEQAEHFRNRLAREEGLYVGYSAAANVCASIALMESGQLGKSPAVATILCDTGLKY